MACRKRGAFYVEILMEAQVGIVPQYGTRPIEFTAFNIQIKPKNWTFLPKRAQFQHNFRCLCAQPKASSVRSAVEFGYLGDRGSTFLRTSSSYASPLYRVSPFLFRSLS